MTSWLEFLLALSAFLGTHFLPTRRNARARLVDLLGRRAYFAIYGTVSLVVLVWLIVAAGRAPYVELWQPSPWQRWVPLLVMPLAAILAVLGLGIRYPYTLGGRAADPDETGLAALSRHPLLWALVLWSAAHIVPNGNLAHVVLFGSFAALGLGAMAIFDRRARSAMTAEKWTAIRDRTALLSVAPLSWMRWRRKHGRAVARGVAVGTVVYLLLLLLHRPVIGVSPMPH